MKGPRLVVYSDGRPQEIRTIVKEIQRCPYCKGRLWLERVKQGDDEWEEHVHKNSRLDGICDALMDPPWEREEEKEGLLKKLKRLVGR